MHLLWGSFEWFCLQISSYSKYLFLSRPRHCDQALIVVIIYYFKIRNKKGHNIIFSWVFSSHMGPVYLEPRHIYTSTEPLCHLYNVAHSYFFSGVQLFWIQAFPSLRLVAVTSLRGRIYQTILPIAWQKEKDSYFSKGIRVKIKLYPVTEFISNNDNRKSTRVAPNHRCRNNKNWGYLFEYRISKIMVMLH